MAGVEGRSSGTATQASPTPASTQGKVVCCMTTKAEKPTLQGQRIKTRKRDEKAKYDPVGFRDAILQGLSEAGSDLEAVNKYLDQAGSKLKYRTYGETLFDILIAGGILTPGGGISEDGIDSGPVRTDMCIFGSPDDSYETLRGYAAVFTRLMRRYKYLEKMFYEEMKKVLVYLKGFREGDRVRLARCVAIWTSDSLLDPKVLTTLLQDHLVKDGLAADFLCEVGLAVFCKRAQEAKTVSALKELNFSQLTLQEKVAIKQAGRPLPDIKIVQEGVSHNKKYIRSFNCDWYQRKTWLCGCEVKNALFCFPCLLFGGDSVWSKDGFAYIKNLKEKTEKHENSRKHIDNVISLSVLGSVNIKERLSEAYRLSVNAHNKKVTKNREILSKIIDCIKFYGHFELPLHGHDETDDSANPGVFRGLINHVSQLDPDLRAHLESNAVFKGVSKTIQNEILDCLLQTYRDQIRKEIKEAPFVAVMADDTTDVSEHTQMVIVLRYLLGEEVVERFWGFFTPENQTVDGLSKCILDQLNTVLEGNAEKLIAQTFDGASIMKGKKRGVQAKIKSVYNNAHFIHCYAHQLNLIMQNAASVTRGSRIFFSNLSGIAAFFSRSPLRLNVLTKHMTSRIPRPSSTRWNFDSHTVNKVYEHFEPLKKCMEEIQSTSNATITIREATGILNTLNDESFKFWLELFHQIMPHVEVIFHQMQCRDIDVTKAHKFITNFKRAISEIRNSKYCENPTKTLMAEAKEVCDCVCADIADRFSFTKQLVAAKLFNKDCFTNFKQKVTLEEVEVATEAYPMIAKGRLLNELRAFYDRSDLHEFSKLSELLKIVNENNLGDVLCELTKLTKILLTIPMTTAEPERCFSTLKRVKTFLRSTMKQERLSALAMISIENIFMNNMPGLNEKVIDLFAQNRNRRMDFLFK